MAQVSGQQVTGASITGRGANKCGAHLMPTIIYNEPLKRRQSDLNRLSFADPGGGLDCGWTGPVRRLRGRDWCDQV